MRLRRRSKNWWENDDTVASVVKILSTEFEFTGHVADLLAARLARGPSDVFEFILDDVVMARFRLKWSKDETVRVAYHPVVGPGNPVIEQRVAVLTAWCRLVTHRTPPPV